MTRKDYVALANALGDALGYCETDNQRRGVERARLCISEALKADNAAFRSEQFREAVEYRASTGRLVKVGQTRFDR